ncbi:response regulator transcription factor [Micromonospora sp. Llam7]|uniref:response regulator transcription factor n=1 Tax=Micromonospora tarapacensis TaxID=2835305 RepID=UPI001C82B59D|nr:response regulator transcription factor [Micromonospora tarapacensis]MBX7268157.1 response regulator transcription factor [Micromonospora tarapacensis]
MRVMLADDSLLFREGLARLLGESGLELVGLAGNADELLAMVRVDPPDVAVVDIRMPPTYTDEGLEAARALRVSHPDVGVLILSHHIDTAFAMRVIDSVGPGGSRSAAGGGGAGYMLKDRVADLEEFADSVRRVGRGRVVLDPSVVARLVGRRRAEVDRLAQLTPRERQVLGLMAEGRSNVAIGRRLRLSQKTVEAHVRSIFNRLGLSAAEDDNRRVLAVLTLLRQ